jgi:polysaccharide pyruvyl transferase WcaK-like protein
MLNKPAISLSYHDKFACLMAGVGLGAYCHDIDELAIDTLTAQIVELEANAATIKPRIKQKVEEYRVALDGQYARVLQSAQPAVWEQVLLPVAKG